MKKKRKNPKKSEPLLSGTYITDSAEETHRLGVAFGNALPPDAVVAFFGDLGAGKTTFIRGLVEGVGSSDIKNVCSPTFTFLNIYPGNKMVYHFDLYRLPRPEEFLTAGFEEYFYAGGVCCIEWAEKIEQILPPKRFGITFSYLKEGSRQIDIWGKQ